MLDYLPANRSTIVGSLRPESLDAFERLFEAINRTLVA